MKFLVVLLVSFSSSFVFAAETCENYAKYFSIRDYKVRAGTIQGSDGITYDSELISVSGNEYTFQVSINDNNEDGEYWTVLYDVTLEKLPNSAKCSLLKLKATDIEE